MIKILTVMALFLPGPLAALTIDQMLGTWSGDGVAAHPGEPAGRFRCRIELRSQGGGTALFSGRCATTQGQQSFTYLVIESADGTVTAQNRSQPLDSLPARLSGQSSAGTVHFEDNLDRMFELKLEGNRLRLRIQGDSGGRPTRGEAFLTRQN
ncbi:MAG: hypothetical protein KDK01_09790 [Rhodobacteraceae bacterium]|nr:hypothetical protein [Paracoccaceae bacterium]